MATKKQEQEQTELMPASTAGQVSLAQATLDKAVTAGAGIDTIERLVKMMERERDDQRRQSFFEAMSGFQAECPRIIKSKEVQRKGGGLLYKYCPLDLIVKVTGPVAQRYGFSHRFETEGGEKGVTVTCIVTHRAGHSEKTPVFIPATQGQHTNAAQNQGVVLTYGQRYSYLGAFGLTISGEDADGNQDGDSPAITSDEVDHIDALIEESGYDYAKTKGRVLSVAGVADIRDMTHEDYLKAVSNLKAAKKGRG